MSGPTLTIAQPSFAAGELSPSLRARTDLAKYRVGAALMKDCFVLNTGGCASRQGTKAVLRSRTTVASGARPRLISFTFSTTQTYMLEFGVIGAAGYLRIIMDGGYVLETGQSVTGASQASLCEISKVAHGYSVGDWIWFSSVAGMTELNSSPGFVGVVKTAAADTFTIQTIDGVDVDSSAWGAFVSGTMARIYTVALPSGMYAYIDELKFSQNNDTVTITSANFAPYNLTRASHTSWSFTAITYAAAVQPPTSPSAVRTNAGSLFYSYQVTSVYDLSGEESIPTAIFQSDVSIALDQDVGRNISISWTAPATGPTPDRYNIYAARPVFDTGVPLPTITGYIGQSTSTEFADTNIAPDFTRGPPKHDDPFATYGNPSCSTYFGGRQWFAATASFPQILVGSQIGNYSNMDYHLPIRADDSLTVSLLSNQVNAIRHLISLNSLLALCDGGAWLISGDTADDAVTATSVRARPQIYDGCSQVPPLNVSSDVLYMSTSSSRMRTLAYDFTTNLFTGTEISLLSSHLFFGYEILAMAYTEEPYPLVHAVRSDGEMNVMSYLKEQDVYAWSHYQTPGNGGSDNGTDKFIDVSVVREGGESAAYVVVERSVPGVNGGDPFYIIERFATRNWSDGNGGVDKDAVWCLDSAVRTSGSGITEVTGLHHMIGGTVLVYGDGSLQATQVVDEGGKITIAEPADEVLVGFGYDPKLQTLRLDLGEPSVQGKRKKVTDVTLLIEDSRGILVAPMKDDINGDSIVGQFRPLRERTTQQTYSSALPFMSGVRKITLEPGWQTDGAVFIKGTPGVPFTILGVVPKVVIGNDPG